MSWLSASTYSWGGEPGRLGVGGDISRVGALWKKARIPRSGFNWMSDSSPDGGGEREEREDSSDESSSAILREFVELSWVDKLAVVTGDGGKARLRSQAREMRPQQKPRH